MSGYTVKNKGVAFIFNVIITAICLASVLAYFVLPLWKVNVSCTLTSDMFRSITGESGENEELMKEIADELEKKPIDAAFDITLKTKTFLASFASDGEKLVAEMVDYNAETLTNQLSGTVKEVSKAAVRATAKNSLKETLKDGSAEYQWKDEETVNAELDKLTDALMKDDATVSSVSDAAADAIANVYKSETGNDIPEADKQAAKAEMEKNAERSGGRERDQRRRPADYRYAGADVIRKFRQRQQRKRRRQRHGRRQRNRRGDLYGGENFHPLYRHRRRIGRNGGFRREFGRNDRRR